MPFNNFTISFPLEPREEKDDAFLTLAGTVQDLPAEPPVDAEEPVACGTEAEKPGGRDGVEDEFAAVDFAGSSLACALLSFPGIS